MKRKITTKDICINAIGIALFVVLSLCLRVPIFQNYYVCLGYVVMLVYLYSIGTFSGTLVGCIGTLIYCILINGLRGMPGWVLGNLVIGITVGTVINLMKSIKNKLIKNVAIIIAIIIGVTSGILGVKSFVEYVLYSQPMIVRIATNTNAFIADIITLLFSLPICYILDKHIRKILSEGSI